MKKIGKLRHAGRTENTTWSDSSTYQIIETVNQLVDAHNELLETHTVKEPEKSMTLPDGKEVSVSYKEIFDQDGKSIEGITAIQVFNGAIVVATAHKMYCNKPELFSSSSHFEESTQPSNSEKEECCEMVKNGQGFHNLSCHKEEIKEQPTTLEKDSCPYGTQTCRYNGNLCSLCRNEEPTTPETKVKISCPDCPHEETDTPEKKCSDESMVASGYIKTPTGWIAQGEATPAQMVYHVSYEVTCGRCEKSIKHSCGRV